MNKHKYVPISFKLIAIFMMVFVSLIANSLLTYKTINSIEDAHRKVTSTIYNINDIVNTNKQLLNTIETFTETRDRDYIDGSYIVIQDFQKKLRDINRKTLDVESQMYLKNVENTLENSYIKYIDELIYRMRAGDNQGVVKAFEKVDRVAGFTDDYLQRIIENRIIESQSINEGIQNETARLLYVNRTIIVMVLIIVGLFIYFMGYPIILGISELSKAAEKVSEGDFEIGLLKTRSNDEFGLLTQVFNRLIKNTRQLIDQIKTNADLEIQLHKQEADKSKIEALLSEAELLGLQSQINPHFLFNTLNIIAKTAILEDAEDTCSLIETVSDMFRYNLRKLGESATLEEEIESISNYLTIQKSRFGNRFKYNLDVDDSILRVEIPYLTLQPIVENAFIHGIEPLEKGGSISINGWKDDKIHLVIRDTGIGMSEEKIQKILYGDLDTHGHTTGIGMANVKRRLEIFFGERCTFSIRSTEGIGTEFEILIEEEKFES